ncbi:MAG: DUF362 domain-containing protein [Candidatus Margulisiibacteriota bacterium]
MSKVYFSSDQARLDKLFDAAGFDKLIGLNDKVALKIHFGEPGNTAYLKPAQVNPIFEKIKSLKGDPFYTDCNTLYKGPRSNTRDHLQVAKDHGYTNVIIPEENDFETIEVNLKHFKKVYIGGAAARAKALIALTHFKGHEMTGFGGALKNIGMGLGTRLGKLKMHQDCQNCPEAKTCRKNQTIESCWVGSPALVQEKIVEYAFGAVKGKKAGFINFITAVSPNCDCYGFNDAPIVPDIGILASTDPVAIDQACIDLVNEHEGRIKGSDKFQVLYPKVDWTIQLKYAEEIGLGKREYDLTTIV